MVPHQKYLLMALYFMCVFKNSKEIIMAPPRGNQNNNGAPTAAPAPEATTAEIKPSPETQYKANDPNAGVAHIADVPGLVNHKLCNNEPDSEDWCKNRMVSQVMANYHVNEGVTNVNAECVTLFVKPGGAGNSTFNMRRCVVKGQFMGPKGTDSFSAHFVNQPENTDKIKVLEFWGVDKIKAAPYLTSYGDPF